MAGFRSRTSVLAAGLIAVTMLAPTSVATQEQFQFVVSARDAEGHPVTDLKRDEIVMLENGVANEIVKIEPFHMPVKLTIAVDNGIHSRDALAHYRSGLEGLAKALPPEIEVALLTMAPQPRFVVTSTLDRNRLRRGINGFAPEEATPRFADTLVELAKRLQDELNKTKGAAAAARHPVDQGHTRPPRGAREQQSPRDAAAGVRRRDRGAASTAAQSGTRDGVATGRLEGTAPESPHRTDASQRDWPGVARRPAITD